MSISGNGKRKNRLDPSHGDTIRWVLRLTDGKSIRVVIFVAVIAILWWTFSSDSLALPGYVLTALLAVAVFWRAMRL